ncbi:hypothetical protein BSL82_15715 [Tardibacter chloracetimidivorans]|uniref:Uncharacterized protein n=1 Tax=Tardibacter chloracetimidivorans TaxID=1921510 RepID=A0A1L3ZY50_9SPHN|nr:hypothetical protein [Tardibacter chloracetimidivorans]API60552.1 hypothetical protein BSL82_15715 [Tardibacter chloracetimidivorans]
MVIAGLALMMAVEAVRPYEDMKLYGATISCVEVVNAFDNPNARFDQSVFYAWINGLLSGMNMAAISLHRGNVYSGPSDGPVKMIVEHCRSHPLDRMTDGLTVALEAIVTKRLKEMGRSQGTAQEK